MQLNSSVYLFSKKIDAEPLDSKSIASILNDCKNTPLDMKNNNDDFRTSITREK